MNAAPQSCPSLLPRRVGADRSVWEADSEDQVQPRLGGGQERGRVWVPGTASGPTFVLRTSGSGWRGDTALQAVREADRRPTGINPAKTSRLEVRRVFAI